MKKSLRVGYNRYYRDDIFEEHLNFIKNNLSSLDEIALFSEFSHYGYWDLNYCAENSDILKRRIKEYKKAGVKSVGINILSTIGHIEEGWSVLKRANLQYLVYSDGSESKAKLCFCNKDYSDYISRRYAMYADTGADFIWMDDDIRGPGCFCDSCIERFNKIHKTAYTRQQLVGLINENTAMKKQWDEYVDNSIIAVVNIVKTAVRSVNPNIKIGYMSIPQNNKKTWLEASEAEMGRPGGGFYDERQPMMVFEKCFNVQQQILNYPERIRDIQYEYEAFNYQNLNRSVHFSELETTLALMSGCNGVLYNCDLFNDRKEIVEMLDRNKAFWNKLTSINEGLRPCGVYCADVMSAIALKQIGIPVTAEKENSVAAFAVGTELRAMDNSDIEELLSVNLFTDGEGVAVLNDRGYYKDCGAKIKEVYDNGMAERFGEHDLNGNYKGYYRDVFMNFSYYIHNSGSAYEFELLPQAEVVSCLEKITHDKLGCCSYFYENSRGKRFAADGYLYPNSLCTSAKKEQITNIIDRLSGSKLPVKINKAVKIVTDVTKNDEGIINIMLTNASFDNTENFECTIRGTGQFYIIGANGELDCAEQVCSAEETIVKITNIAPWNYVIITNKK